MKTLLYTLILFFQATLTFAQTDTEFWFAVPYVTDQHDGEVGAYLRLTSTGQPAVVTIEQPFNPQIAPITVDIPANETRTVNFTDDDYDKIAGSGISYDVKTNYALHIKSDNEITAYFELTECDAGTFKNFNNPELFSLKGTNGLGYEFYTPFQDTWWNQNYSTTEPAYSSIDIVATEDFTEIEIYLRNNAAKLGGGVHEAESTISIVLNKGQTYSVVPEFENDKPSCNPAKRLKGTKITSNKPISVTIKDDSVIKNSNWNLIGDQLVPLRNIKNKPVVGHEYLVMKGKLTDGGSPSGPERFYILSTENGTNVSIDGTSLGFALPEGFQYAATIPEGTNYKHIVSDKPIYVFHVSGNRHEMAGAVLPTIDGCSGSLSVSFVRSKGTKNITSSNKLYLNIMTKDYAVDSFKVEINGVVQPGLITSSMFEQAGTSGWYVLKELYKDFTAKIDPNLVVRVYNTAAVFHLGILNGRGDGEGNMYGYFSNFDELKAEAINIENGTPLIHLCGVDTVQLKAKGGLSYLWSPEEYVDDPTSACPKVFPPKGTTTTFTVKILHPCNGYQNKYVSVSFPALPTALIELSKKQGCSPLEIDFTNGSSGGSTYVHDFGDGSAYLATANYEDVNRTNVYYNTSDTLSYYISAFSIKNINGCTSEQYDTIWVLPAVNTDFEADKYVACEGDQVSFTNTSTGNLFTSDWDFKDGFTSSGNNPKHQFTEAGEYNVSMVATSVEGCQDMIEKTITINKTYSTEQVISACYSYTWNETNETYTESGNYLASYSTQNGCDSVITLNLTINHAAETEQSISTCDAYTWPTNNITYFESGTYTDTLSTIAECDSIVTLILSISKSDTITETTEMCSSYTWPETGDVYTESGQYTNVLTNINGCDSVIILDLTINHPVETEQSISACDAYTWPTNNITYYKSGTYSDTLSAISGCDSIVTLNLSISKSDTITETTEICSSYTWPETGDIYTESGQYTNVLTNKNGCDSIIILDLTINNPTETNHSISTCDAYTWPVNNITYFESGIYSDTLSTIAGCDSIIKLNLSISKSDTTTKKVNACSAYAWVETGDVYTESGQYTTILTNKKGCDSVIILDLTISHPTETNQSISACDSYTWPTNNIAYFESGIYSDTLSTIAGCDSIVTLDLSINKSDTTTETMVKCNYYTWPETGDTYFSTGKYTTILTNKNGCDSVVILDLIINQQYGTFDSIVTCKPYTWPINNITYYESGTYTQTHPDSKGCDSINYLYLAINSFDLFVNETEEGLEACEQKANYQWLNCSDNYSNIVNATNKQFNPTTFGLTSGEYAVKIEQNGCIDTSGCYQVVLSDIQDKYEELIDIFPNPSNGYINVVMEKEHKNIKIDVINFAGQTLMSKEFKDRMNFDLEIDAPAGYYLLKIQTESEQMYMHKIVIL